MIIHVKLDYNPETNECKVIETKVEAAKASTSKPDKVPESDEPQIILGKSNYTLNLAAVELMQVCPNTRININYQLIDGLTYPIIGTEENFGVNGGNKLNKNLTVNYRGKANERLSEYGEVFTLTPLKNSPGLFILMGDKEPEIVPDDIKIVEDVADHSEMPEEDPPITDMDDEPLSFDDDPTFPGLEDSTLIEEDSLVFE